MRFVDEYREPAAVLRAATEVRRQATRTWRIMEVCGGQTHAILASGLDTLLEDAVELLHGPGCPVCVTPLETLDRALAPADRPDVTLVSFGDMLRVPGSRGDLFAARARGADVRVVYSPLDAVHLATELPARQVVFLAVGFETTAPAVAGAVRFARARRIQNFSVLLAHVRVPPALVAIRSAPECRVDAFLAAGHVCTVMGTREYEPIARELRVPIVATGFEPLDLLHGAALAVAQLESGEARVEIQYRRAVRPEGNVHARALLADVYRVVKRSPPRSRSPRRLLRGRRTWGSSFPSRPCTGSSSTVPGRDRTTIPSCAVQPDLPSRSVCPARQHRSRSGYPARATPRRPSSPWAVISKPHRRS